jgi:hypothetical protein
MTTRPVPRARRKAGRLTITIIAAMFALLGAFYLLDRLVQNPWSTSLGGRPTLTGYWQGTVDFAPDDRRDVVVHLRYNWDPGRDRSGWPSIMGAIEVCGPRGTLTADLSGEPENRSGSRFWVDPKDSAGPAIRLGRVHGKWDGDRIAIRGTSYQQAADSSATGSVSTTPSGGGEGEPRVAFELRRTTKASFDDAC